jgi:hypothetical protein
MAGQKLGAVLRKYPRLTEAQFMCVCGNKRDCPTVSAARDVLVGGQGLTNSARKHGVFASPVSHKVARIIARHKAVLAAYNIKGE